MDPIYKEIKAIARQKNSKEIDKNSLEKLKIKLAKKYHLGNLPRDSDILLNTGLDIKTKSIRTLSGVAPIAVMTRPERCPHGKCTFCPGGPGSYFGDTPQSYTGREPSTMRAIRNNYDPYLIVFNRLEQYICMNQSPEKAEVIIQGGTFPALSKEYQEYVVKYILQAMNDFSSLFYKSGKLQIKKFKTFFELPSSINSPERSKKIQEKLLKLKKETSLEKEQERNESAQVRCIGLTIETKPDWGFLKQGNEMLRLGCTRVELGVQCLDPAVLKATHRGHTLEDTKKSFQILKDLGFKINAHIMLGLPGQTKAVMLQEIKDLFQNPDYKPDMLKLYPCLVLPGTALFAQWKSGAYKPLTIEETADIIAETKRCIPRWCRIMRIQRDIPSTVISAGPIKTNLRQEVEKICKKRNIQCQCIRCRESGRKEVKNPQLTIEQYDSSGGKEFFIAIEDKTTNTLAGFCRLRFPSQQLRKEIAPKTAIIRELHVFSQALPLGEKPKGGEASGTAGSYAQQHRGYGQQLMLKAEALAKQHKKDKLIVIAGIGVKEYYIRKLGYKKEGPYVSKMLK